MRMVSELKTKLADVKKNSSKDVAALQSKLAKVPSTVHSRTTPRLLLYDIENCTPNCIRHSKHTYISITQCFEVGILSLPFTSPSPLPPLPPGDKGLFSERSRHARSSDGGPRKVC